MHAHAAPFKKRMVYVNHWCISTLLLAHVSISCVCRRIHGSATFSNFSIYCGFRFHLLDEFDDAKKSCRKRLADHNRRRRKSKPSDADAADKRKTQASKAASTKGSMWSASIHFLYLIMHPIDTYTSILPRFSPPTFQVNNTSNTNLCKQKQQEAAARAPAPETGWTYKYSWGVQTCPKILTKQWALER